MRAVAETAYYGNLYPACGIDPARLRFENLGHLPLTPKAALREDPDAFVRRTARPALHVATTGTTGRPTQVAFSAAELRTMVALSALAYLLQGQLAHDDVVQLNISSRATLGNLGLAGAGGHVGALVRPVGLVEPAQTLALLTEKHRLVAKKPQVSLMSTYPSYLGELVEAGLDLGYAPAAFGLERIVLVGELVTAGLKARARRLFGPVRFEQGYAMTETLPFGGTMCEQGHLHFEPAHGLLEVVDPETNAPSAPGEAGTIVATPFPPFRETILLLRNDTQDVVRPLAGPLTCSLRHRPATTDLLGKLRLATRHDTGWTYPRDVLEALEAIDAVPLPAHCGWWATPVGVAVEVVVRDEGTAVRREVVRRLEDRGVPIQELYLVTNRSQLRHPIPLRRGLREVSFDAGPSDAASVLRQAAAILGQGD